ncbi:MAG TPA: NAD-dependent epimerase/dehydratase family protein, partial [Terriglobia bacterium]|nr:NAD-dependent epimerase/dehydratase family protein [Terriglobia bacterium]
TGATGFLGKHLVEQLKASESEARIRVLCRGVSPWDKDAAIEAIRGDITNPADVDRAVAGASEIYHLAGVVSRDPRAASLLYETHIEGTRQVCQAARRHGVRRIVLVSSSGTLAVSREPVAYDENSGYKHEVVAEWPYYLSKIFAEKLALSYFAQYKLPEVIVNPSLLLGPGDDRGSSTQDVALFLAGQILAIPLGGLNFVDARDTAAGLIAAMRAGKPGERYLVGGPNWTFREFIQHLSEVSGVRAPKLQPSFKMQLASARLLRRLMPLVGKSFPLDDVSIRMSALFWYCDTRKARAELGFTTRDPLETLKDTVEDLRRRKLA